MAVLVVGVVVGEVVGAVLVVGERCALYIKSLIYSVKKVFLEHAVVYIASL